MAKSRSNVYFVEYEDFSLYFIAEDQDMLMTLVSQQLENYDYANLISKLKIQRVAGKNHCDGMDFYLRLAYDKN